MKVHLNEITQQEKLLDFSEKDAWVIKAIENLDEFDDDQTSALNLARGLTNKPKLRAADLHFNLRKVDEVVVITGKIATSLNLLCSRCGQSFRLPCDTQFSALFCQDPVLAGVDHRGHPSKQLHGRAHDEDSSDFEMTFLTEDFIELSDVLTEQLRLQIPFQPLCKEDCKGVCPSCGIDFNRGNCACSKLFSHSAFASLKNLQ